MYHSALVLSRTREKEGAYTVHQVETRECPTIASFAQRKSRQPIEAMVSDAFYVQGWIDMSTSETMIRVELAGHDLGVFHGMANKALRINLRLQFVHGTVILELNPFDELWLHVDTVRADKKERFSIFDCKKSELLQRCSGVSCETWV